MRFLSEGTLVDAARWALIVALSLTLALVVQVAAIRLTRTVRGRRRRRFLEEWRPRLARAVSGSAGPLRPVGRADEETLLEVWNHSQEIVQGEGRDRLGEFGRRMDLGGVARRLLARRGMRCRLMAMETLGNLRDPLAWQDLERYVAGPNRYLSLSAATAMARIDPARAAPVVVPLVATRHDWSSAHVARLLREAGPSFVSEPLAAAAVRAGPEDAPRLIRYLENCHAEHALPAIRVVLAAARDEPTVGACLQALGRFRDPTDLQRLRAHLDNPAWHLRMHAVAALGGMAVPEDEARIVRMLSDASWWVRYRAAQALSVLPGMDAQRLAGIRSRIDDPYGRGMLDQVIAEISMG